MNSKITILKCIKQKKTICMTPPKQRTSLLNCVTGIFGPGKVVTNIHEQLTTDIASNLWCTQNTH